MRRVILNTTDKPRCRYIQARTGNHLFFTNDCVFQSAIMLELSIL